MTQTGDDQLSKALAALADPTRRQIIAHLARQDATVGELSKPYAMSLQAVSKHIKVLEEAGLVRRVNGGKRAVRRLDADALRGVELWLEQFRTQAESRFRRLDAVLENMESVE